jgi:trehalose utilization protein
MAQKIRVTVWNEGVHEKTNEKVKKIYPNGMHAVIAKALKAEGDIETRVATLDDPEHGLTEKVLDSTDVLTWWGHVAHSKVQDEIVDRVQKKVLEGMGLICLHSAHFSKIFRRLMGTNCSLKCSRSRRLSSHGPARRARCRLGTGRSQLRHHEL